MTGLAAVKRAVKAGLSLPAVAAARLRANTASAARFSGVYATYAAAVAALPADRKSGYDDGTIVDVSLAWMCKRAAWDYPLLYWLKTMLPDGGSVTDAGGHLGTKYRAFSDVLDIGKYDWTVFDLPQIIAAARARQTGGDIPKEVRLCDRQQDLPPADVLIASGFLQYFDGTLQRFLRDLPEVPRFILINKLPSRSGDPVFTIERIGSAKVPYQIRSDVAWRAEVAAAGYVIADVWPIPELSHVIATHPGLGASESHGYLLVRTDAKTESQPEMMTAR